MLLNYQLSCVSGCTSVQITLHIKELFSNKGWVYFHGWEYHWEFTVHAVTNIASWRLALLPLSNYIHTSLSQKTRQAYWELGCMLNHIMCIQISAWIQSPLNMLEWNSVRFGKKGRNLQATLGLNWDLNLRPFRSWESECVLIPLTTTRRNDGG